jgi:TldD protein
VPKTASSSLEEYQGFLDEPLKGGATYADLKLYIERGSQAALRATSSDFQTFDRSVGVARVVFGKGWGIHVIEKPSRGSLKEACILALKLAKSADSTSILEKPIKLANIPQSKCRVRHESKEDPLIVEVDQKIKLVKDLEQRARDALKESFGWCEVVYGDIQSDFSLISSEGACINEQTPSVDLLVYITARGGERIEGASKFIGYTQGYEAIKNIDVDVLVEGIAERALKLASAKNSVCDLLGKKIPVVMDSECSGAFVHEAVAHPVEADFMLEAGSVFEDSMEQQIAVKELTVSDDATMPGLYGTYSYDDEGVEARKIRIIENGTLRSLLHTRETAYEMDTEPTGSAHGLTHVPRCLMSNIYSEPRDWKHEELIEETRKGVFIEGVVRAQSTPINGSLKIQPEVATTIKNGELQDTLRGRVITGKILEALKSIDGIGNKLSLRASVEKEFNITDGGPPTRLTSMRLQ